MAGWFLCNVLKPSSLGIPDLRGWVILIEATSYQEHTPINRCRAQETTAFAHLPWSISVSYISRSVIQILMPSLLCHKDTAQGTWCQLYLGNFFFFPLGLYRILSVHVLWVALTVSLWYMRAGINNVWISRTSSGPVLWERKTLNLLSSTPA